MIAKKQSHPIGFLWIPTDFVSRSCCCTVLPVTSPTPSSQSSPSTASTRSGGRQPGTPYTPTTPSSQYLLRKRKTGFRWLNNFVIWDSKSIQITVCTECKKNTVKEDCISLNYNSVSMFITTGLLFPY